MVYRRSKITFGNPDMSGYPSNNTAVLPEFDGASTYTEGSYYNYDFMDVSLRTDVYQRARTWMYQGNARWSTTLVDSGEFSHWISGVNGYNDAYCF